MSVNPKGTFDLAIPMVFLQLMNGEILVWNPLEDKAARHSFWFTSLPNLKLGADAFKFDEYRVAAVDSWQQALKFALFARDTFACTWVAVDPNGDKFESIAIDKFIEDIRKRIPSTERGITGMN